MKQITKIDLDAEIKPNEGIGNIKFGLHLFYFRDIYTKSFTQNGYHTPDNPSDWNLYMPRAVIESIILEYKKIIKIEFNSMIGKVSRIELNQGYKGKLWGRIRVGDSVKKLFDFMKNIEYEVCEGILVFNNHNNIWFIIGTYFEDDLEFEELRNRKIIRISFFNKELDYFPNVMEDLPESWKNSKPDILGI